MRKKIFLILLFIAIIGLILSMLPEEAFGRAGRGNSYRAPSRSSSSGGFRSSSSGGYRSSSSGGYRSSSSGGYRSSSSGGYRSSSSGYSSSGYSRNYGGRNYGSAGCCGCGGIGTIIVIVIILLVIFGKRKGGPPGGPADGGSFVPNMGGDPVNPPSMYSPPPAPFGGFSSAPPREIDEEKVKGQVEELRMKDPNFSTKVFLDKVQTYFDEIQRAFSRGNMEPVRNRMSESQFRRMSNQLQDLKDRGLRNVLEEIVIGGAKIADVNIEGDYDSIKVRFNASMIDYDLDQNNRVVRGNKNQPEGFTEYWTFIRKQGAKTAEDGGLTIAHNCPSCGAPLESIDIAKCNYCSTTITNASFDWVLDTITQEGEE